MVAREDLYKLVDQLPACELESAHVLLEFLKTRTGDRMRIALALAPWDDEPTTPEEDASAEEAWQRYLRGEYITAEEAKHLLLSDPE